MDFLEFLKTLTDPSSIIHYGGLALLLFIIFAENGILIGFFLPGDSLIFLSGLICATQPHLLQTDIYPLTLYMFTAAVSGSLFGYAFGRKVGPPVFDRKDSFFFKRKYVDMTRDFYAKHGGKTLILGRFLPIIRTFAPILAGAIRVDFKTFMLNNFVGGALWIGSLSFIGYYLGNRFPAIENYLGYIIIGFIGVTTLVLIRSLLARKKNNS
jgi:membrane-associated protein